MNAFNKMHARYHRYGIANKTAKRFLPLIFNCKSLLLYDRSRTSFFFSSEKLLLLIRVVYRESIRHRCECLYPINLLCILNSVLFFVCAFLNALQMNCNFKYSKESIAHGLFFADYEAQWAAWKKHKNCRKARTCFN